MRSGPCAEQRPVIVSTYGAALIVLVASVVLGRAITVACGASEDWSSSPAVGLAATIVLATAAIKLPGRAVVSICVVAAALIVAAGYLWRRRIAPAHLSDALVIVVPLFAATVPFIASGRVELQGVSFLNDSANHLMWAEGLRNPHLAQLWRPPSGYPLGPHSVVASIGTLIGSRLTLVFAGLLVAIGPITALVAQGLVAERSLWRRVVVAVMCSSGYLLASYYAEGAFKETIMAALVLGLVLHAEGVAAAWSELSARRRPLALVPLVVLAAGAVYTYSYLGLAWFGATLVLWLLAALARDPSLLRRASSAVFSVRGLKWVGGTILLLAILSAPVASQAISFFKTFGPTPGGVGAIPAPLANLIHALPPWEALGQWLSTDFRKSPPDFPSTELTIFAAVLLITGLVWSVRRRMFVLPAAVVGCAIIWFLAHQSGSPYVAAKALVIAVPVVTGLILRPLVSSAVARGPMLAVLAVFCVFGLDSSYHDLRNMPVDAPEPAHELQTFAATIGTDRVLFLGDDDYSPWQLQPAKVASLSGETKSIVEALPRPSKPWVSGDALDFDSVSSQDLNRFPYVVTSTGSYASQAPPNFHLVKRLQFYELWKREGRSPPRDILERSGAPGAILNCKTTAGRRLSREPGEASVIPTPIVTPGPSLFPGTSATFALGLPRGRWQISAQYFSDFTVSVTLGSVHRSLPAYLGRVGPFFEIGTVTGTGTKAPIPLTVRVSKPAPLTGLGGDIYGQLPLIAATRVPTGRHLVPLRRACGRYVDWYRPR
jgi:hypothetical protein